MAWWCNGYGVGLRLERSRVQLPGEPLSGNDLGQVVHTRASVTMQYSQVHNAVHQAEEHRGAAMSCDWEGNRRSGVALAMVTDMSGLPTYGLKA